ncbi:MAG: hypothetical protein AB1523_00145 [Bacillota bacterium]
MQPISFVEIEMGLRALEAAQQKLDYADDAELIDAAVFEFEAARRRLNYLFKLARRGMAHGKSNED